MAAVGFAFALVALVVTVGAGLVLYALVRSEHGQRTVTDRETAERLAREDGGGTDASSRKSDGSDRRDEDVEGNHWG